MMHKSIRSIFILANLLFFCTGLLAQNKLYDGPNDGAGDPVLEKEGFMAGNRVQLLFKNNTELGDFPRKDASRWPKGTGGNVMHDGIGLLVSAKVYLRDRVHPVTDPDSIVYYRESGRLDSLFYCETNYREEMDRDPTGQIEWGFHPAPGYSSITSETPALSNEIHSWPEAGWPYRGRELHWAGEWDGRFGRGQTRANLECYFVANDAQDLEYLGKDDYVKYYPKKDLKIGDIDPRTTIQAGKPWGGIGVRVKQRGFQWNNAMAQDCIFWEYTIANISDYDLPNVAFGYWIDNDIGGENTGEDGSYDRIERMAYTWDTDGIGETGIQTGTQGFAFLESPGKIDGIDNDFDGLVDEARNNDAGDFLENPTQNIYDFDLFYQAFGTHPNDLEPHWSGDEDGDWVDGNDEDNNGVYSATEFAGDDIGLDGVSPGEENYYGPDEDGTECNHKPDLSEQGYAEPNFGWTDVSETDMLGLTTLLFDPIPSHVTPYEAWSRNDQSMWERMTYIDSLESGAINIQNLGELFASAIFPLNKGRTEFISLAELHSYDDLAGLNAGGTAPVLFNLKKTVQIIYEKDYQFAEPPETPTLTAVPGDGYVDLVWDNRADLLTRERLLNFENDFEGYKVYRATDQDFTDPVQITDGYGSKRFMKWKFQCDKRDGIKGYADFGLIDGAAYYLGDDKGLCYSWRDETVQNGRTYYYAVVAYDYGIAPGRLQGSSVITQDEKFGVTPYENDVIIRTDEFENLKFRGRNVAIVVPGTSSAGKTSNVEYAIDSEKSERIATIVPEVVAPGLLTGHEYKIKFETFNIQTERIGKTYYHQKVTNGIKVYDVTLNNKLVLNDVINKEEGNRPDKYKTALEFFDGPGADDYFHLAHTTSKPTDVFDGLKLNIQMDIKTAKFDSSNSGWMPGSAPINVKLTDVGQAYYPGHYQIVFSEDSLYTTVNSKYSDGFFDSEDNHFSVRDILRDESYPFRVENLLNRDTDGKPELLDIVAYDANDNDTFDIFEDLVLVGRATNAKWEKTIFTIDFSAVPDESQLPVHNDVYTVFFQEPFYESDSIMFSVNYTEEIDQPSVEYEMKDIKVVPNPYIATNLMEKSVVNKYLNQGRRIMFTHLPQRCTIKIFSVSGILIRELRYPDDSLVNFGGFGVSSDGMMHWDLLSEEGLDIAAGMYIYHVEDEETGREKIGKFGVVK